MIKEEAAKIYDEVISDLQASVVGFSSRVFVVEIKNLLIFNV